MSGGVGGREVLGGGDGVTEFGEVVEYFVVFALGDGDGEVGGVNEEAV